MSRLKSRSIVTEMRVKQGIYVAVFVYPYLIDTDFRVNVMADEKKLNDLTIGGNYKL